MNPSVLVVEDDPKIAEGVSRALTAAGYLVRIAHGCTEAQVSYGENPAQLVLLDLTLPDGDGITLCRQLRRDGDARIVIVTARDDDLDVIAGLDAGANDYVTKPFSMPVLLARVRAQLRVDSPNRAPIVVGPLVIDGDAHRATVHGHTLELRPREFAVLELLGQERGRVVTHRRLLQDLWTHDADPTSRKSLDTHIHTLRRKLAGAGMHDTIATIRGIGYRLDVP